MPEPTTEKLKCSSIEELKIWAELPKKISLLDDQQFIKAVEKLFQEGVERWTKGDEEMAYVYFSRIFHCLVKFKASSKTVDEKYLKFTVGRQIKESMDKLDILTASLSAKYQLQAQLEESLSQKGQGKMNGESDIGVRDSVEKLSLSIPHLNGVNSLPEEDKTTISSTELFNMINSENPPTTLILDLRLKEDFDNSCMKIKDVINVPQNFIIPECIPSKLELLLEERFKPYFRRRGDYDRVIVLDWSSRSSPHPKMSLMLSRLTKYDTRVKYKFPPLMLEGGYEDWASRYPTLTTNHIISPPIESINDKFSLEKISYPTNVLFEQSKVEKPSTIVSPPSNPRPSIDRSTKPPTLQEKKPEGADDLKDNLSIESVAKKRPSAGTVDNSAAKTVIKNEISETKPPAVVNGRRESLESDDEELKKQYCRSGRRAALTENGDRSPLVYRKNEDEDDESARNNSAQDGDESFRTKKAVNNIHHENGMKMKRSSSTPNISELGINECSRPPIDRSTKPSNDDQLNYYTTGYIYNEIGKGLTGLKNIGNTCYMNSILQCLSNTDPLRKKLCSWDLRVINEKSKTRGAVAREVISIVKQLWSGEGGFISCKSFKNIVGQYNNMFSGHDQQDAHEFLTILMDWLHEDLNEPPTKQNLDGADEKSGEKAWGEFIRKNNSIIRKLFYGQLRSTVSCNTCNEQSVTFEPFSNLSLSLPPEEIDKCTLTECLKLYISNEDVDKWQCPRCKELRRATKKLDITKLPPLLVIHFKRFTSVGGCKKQRTYIDFPDTLNMRPYIVGDEHRHQQYQLYAVSNHSGSMESGHYTAYCKNPADRRWYEFDDQNVYPMNTIPKSREAYIVFYQTVKN